MNVWSNRLCFFVVVVELLASINEATQIKNEEYTGLLSSLYFSV